LERDADGRLHRELGRTIAFYQPFLAMTIDQLRQRFNPSVEQILDFLYASPVFSDNRRNLLREGLEAYENQDFVKAIHVLVPQVEHALRNILVLLGIPTVKTVPRHPGIVDFKSMNDVLTDSRVQDLFGEDFWRYLTVLYIDRRGGFNLRNDLAHGLMDTDSFQRHMADRVVHSMLALALLRKTENVENCE